jgi:outer membrane beta-barrel protein
MKRLAFGLFLLLGNPGLAAAAGESAPPADDGAGEQPAEAEAPPAEASEAAAKDELPDLSDEVKEAGSTPKEDAAKAGAAAKRAWDDIVVVPRKAFLKGGRLELAPFTAMSVNDVLIRHYAFGGDMTYYLTDVFSVGLQGQYFIKERSERESLVGYQFNRVSTLNRFKYSGHLVFGYVPGYGKFGLFNRHIVHWDVSINGGIGMIRTEIIPVLPTDEAFGGYRICPMVGISSRMFITDWLSVSMGLRDYIFLDKFEPLSRHGYPVREGEPTYDPGNPNKTRAMTLDEAKANTSSSLVQNMMVFVSIGFYLPPSFQYKTPR